MIAVFFGIAGGVGGYFVKAAWDAALKVREDTATVTELTTTVTGLQNAVSTVSSTVEKASMPVLLTRIRDFASAPPQPHYGWSDYQSDMQSLSDFAVVYLTLVENKAALVNPQQSQKFAHGVGNQDLG